MRRVLLALLALAMATAPLPAAQSSDLDRLMERVLARRDENWKKLQQYVLEERETLDVTGPGGARLFGFRRDYSWFLREGVFIRSPLRADGVTIPESDRRKAEESWLRRERRREERRAERARTTAAESADAAAPADAPQPVPEPASPAADTSSADVLPSSATVTSIEPAFVSYAYFLRFRFEPNHYGMVGRETLDGRSVIRIEYYPSELFREGRTRPNRKVRDREEDVEDKMNMVSLVTLWVDPEALQILQYTFDDIDMDFLPGRSVARVDDMKATMRMGQPFPGVWLPRDIEMKFRMALAAGAFDARYRVEYHDYRQADVTYKVR
jgi:hypothetical protein